MTTTALAPMSTTSATAVPAEPSGSNPVTKTPTPTSSTPADKNGAIGAQPKDNPGVFRVQGGGEETKLAQGLMLPRPEPRSMVQTWMRALEQPARYEPKFGAPLRSVTVRSSTSVLLPVRPSPLGSVFSPGSAMKTWPGETPTRTTVGEAALAVGNRALTTDRLARFAALKPEQQEVARTMLKRALDGLQLPAYNNQHIAPDEFAGVVDSVLDSVSAWQGPKQTSLPLTEPNPALRPGAGAQLPAGSGAQLPVGGRTAQLPVGDAAGTTTPPARNTSSPAYPSTGPNDPKPSWWDAAADPNLAWTPDPTKPLAGQKEPSWWKDPKMTTWLANLNVTSREFAAQATSIDIDRPVDPARSSLTPRQEWQNWKAA